MSTIESKLTGDGDGEQWKEKYRDTVRELDTKELQWRDSEIHLHKILLRLSFSYKGLDPRLDIDLKQLQSALKKNPDNETRGKLITDIVDKITRVNSERNDEKNSHAAAGLILARLGENLRLPESHARERDLISAKLKRADESTLKEASGQLAELINEVIEQRNEMVSPRDGDTFLEFLNRFSLAGSLGEKVTSLQHRSAEIKTELERLAVIDDTIDLLSEELDREHSPTIGASEAQAIVRELIEWMTLPSQVKEELKGIQSKLVSAKTEDNLSSILRDLGRTVSQFHSTLMSELTDVEYYLKNIAIRLKELQIGIEGAFADQQVSFGEQENLSSGIADQVGAIVAKLTEEDDLNAIKDFIDDGLSNIGTRMREHLARDRKRVVAGEERLRRLSGQLKTMDEESTRLRAQVQHERNRAQHDALTGVANRAAYEDRIATEITQMRRHNRGLSLAVIDIDKFKNVNDTFGHNAGDKVLKNVARICAANIRANDFLARYGGEEFVLVLPESSLDRAYTVAEKLRQAIENKGFYYDGNKVPITVSVGVAQFAQKESPESVFQRADKALYAAKKSGRNRCMKESEVA